MASSLYRPSLQCCRRCLGRHTCSLGCHHHPPGDLCPIDGCRGRCRRLSSKTSHVDDEAQLVGLLQLVGVLSKKPLAMIASSCYGYRCRPRGSPAGIWVLSLRSRASPVTGGKGVTGSATMRIFEHSSGLRCTLLDLCYFV